VFPKAGNITRLERLIYPGGNGKNKLILVAFYFKKGVVTG